MGDIRTPFAEVTFGQQRHAHMRIAAIYDIHGNLPALEAVLEDVAGARVDLIVVGGDVLPGPLPRETLERLLCLDVPVQFISGNGDRAVREQMAGTEASSLPESVRHIIRWTAAQLDPSHQQVLASWPATWRVRTISLGEVLFCHATPRNDTDIFTRRTAEDRLREVFAPANADLVVCGHTHMQFDRQIGEVRVVNAGSVGMPFGEPGAYWLLLGPGIELRQTSYDLHKAAEAVRATSYPAAEAFAAQDILRPRPADEMLDLFAKAELQE